MDKLWLKSIIALALVFCFATVGVDANGVVFAQVQKLLVVRDELALREAQELLVEFLEENADNVEALCLLAEVHFYYGDWFLSQKQIQIWEKGKQFAEEAVLIDPNFADAHYWVAALMGKIGNAQGILASLFLVNPMLEHLDKALELDPNHSWAHFILSFLYQSLPPRPISRGDLKQALACAQKAWELEPTEPEFVVQYARLLINQQKEDQASELLEEALASTVLQWTDSLKQESVELLAKLR